jgi:hypothetical protein
MRCRQRAKPTRSMPKPMARGNRVNPQTLLQSTLRSFTLLTGLTPGVAELQLVLLVNDWVLI